MFYALEDLKCCQSISLDLLCPNVLSVAQRVLAKGNVQFDNLNLIVQPHIPDNVPQPEGAEGGNDIPEEMEHSSHQEEPSASTSKYGKFNCIEVSGLPPTTSEEFVRLFFESGRYSNGGEIDNLTLNLENGTAVIIFKEESSRLLIDNLLLS